MVNVLLLDDHAVVRTGYRRLIDAELCTAKAAGDAPPPLLRRRGGPA